MVAGIDRWPHGEPDLHEPRLERDSRSTDSSPPAREDGGHPGRAVPALVLVPEMQASRRPQTPRDAFDSNVCGDCNRTLVPRASWSCARGHIDDFPYMRWVHEGKPAEGVTHELYIEARARRRSPRHRDHVQLRRRRTMDKAFDKFAFRDRHVLRATALARRPRGLRHRVRTLQRGASNVWFGSAGRSSPSRRGRTPRSSCSTSYWDILRAMPGQRHQDDDREPRPRATGGSPPMTLSRPSTSGRRSKEATDRPRALRGGAPARGVRSARSRASGELGTAQFAAVEARSQTSSDPGSPR